MISYKKALELILDSVRPLLPEDIPLGEAYNRILAQDIVSGQDIPPFTNSAMDGYAIMYQDVAEGAAVTLKNIEDLPAGSVSSSEIVPGTCIKIMTGAPLPEGADTVVMKEYTEEQGENLVKISGDNKKGQHIRYRGEDIKQGDIVLDKGTFLRPQDIGIMVSVGVKDVSVYKRPRVGIVTTGDELVGLGEDIAEGKIRESNSYVIMGQVLDAGAEAFRLGIAEDNEQSIKAKLTEAMNYDVIVTCGGVSVGDYDLVKDILQDIGVEMRFWKVAMKPAKPLAFGVIDGKPVFGLPGNPTASMLAFEQFVRPAVLRLMGARNIKRPILKAELLEDIKHKPGRVHFVRGIVSFEDGLPFVRRAGPQGSAMQKTMSMSNCLIIINTEDKLVSKGTHVDVQLTGHGEIAE